MPLFMQTVDEAIRKHCPETKRETSDMSRAERVGALKHFFNEYLAETSASSFNEEMNEFFTTFLKKYQRGCRKQNLLFGRHNK